MSYRITDTERIERILSKSAGSDLFVELVRERRVNELGKVHFAKVAYCHCGYYEVFTAETERALQEHLREHIFAGALRIPSLATALEKAGRFFGG